MKHVRGFLFSLAFIALALLAFNPHWVVKIQERINPAPNNWTETPANIVTSDPPDLPKTRGPDLDNLPRLKAIEKIAERDPWIGSAPCSIDIFDAPESLPGLGSREAGPLLTEAIHATGEQSIVNQPTYLFKSQGGITLKLVQPAVEYYEVTGRRYRDVQKDIFDRRPLEKMRETEDKIFASTADDKSRKKPRVTRAADIYSPSTLSYTISGSRDRYEIVKNKTIMTSAFLVTLPRWETYDAASKTDQAKWDDFFCNVAHHELGHLRIRLDILAQTLDGYAFLPPAQSSKEMKELIIEYRKDISARVQTRQDAYHIYNDGGLRRGMIELPYADLPFPWLETPKMAEQLPE